MTITIKHPAPTPGEISANGLTFIDGVAETDVDISDIRPILEEHGYTFEGTPSAPSEPWRVLRFLKGDDKAKGELIADEFATRDEAAAFAEERSKDAGELYSYTVVEQPAPKAKSTK